MELEPLEEWGTWRDLHLDYIQNECGITNATEYARKFGDEKHLSNEHIRKLLNDIGDDLLAFERMYPPLNQDIAVVRINPGFNWATPPEDADPYRLSEEADPLDWEKRMTISMRGLHRSFGDNLLTILRDFIDTSPINLQSDVVDNKEAFFSNIYYTNWYKFATRKSDDLHQLRKSSSFPAAILREELRLIDPDFVLTFGSEPWDYGLKKHITPIGDGPASDGVTSVQNYVYECSLRDSSFWLMPFPFSKDPRNLDYRPDKFVQELSNVK